MFPYLGFVGAGVCLSLGFMMLLRGKLASTYFHTVAFIQISDANIRYVKGSKTHFARGNKFVIEVTKIHPNKVAGNLNVCRSIFVPRV